MTVSLNTHPDAPNFMSDDGTYRNKSSFHDARDGMPAFDTPRPEPHVRTGGQVFRYDPMGGSRAMGNESLNTSDFYSQGDDGNILSTARSATGSPVLGRELRPDDIVVVRGMETTVAMAERVGLLVRNDHGRLVNGASPDQMMRSEQEAAQKAAEAKQKAELDALEGFASQREEALLAEMVSATSGGAQLAALADVVERGDLRQDTLHRLATEMGKDPQYVQGRMDAVYDSFVNQAAAAVSSVGVPDPVGFAEWAEKNHPSEFKQAQFQQVRDRSTAGWLALGQQYVERLDTIDPDAILEAQFGGGLSAFKNTDGKIIIRTADGVTMAWREAIRGGFIKLSKAGGRR